jgi:hypothetical protein
LSPRVGHSFAQVEQQQQQQQDAGDGDGALLVSGLTQIEMFDGRVPHASLLGTEVMQTIVDSVAPKPVRPPFADFLSACLQKDPAQRKTAVELLAMPFIAAEAVQMTSARRREVMSAFVQLGVAGYARRGRKSSRSGATTASRTSRLSLKRGSSSTDFAALASKSTTSIRSDDSERELVLVRTELTAARDTIAQQSAEITDLKAVVEKQSAELARCRADLAKATAALTAAATAAKEKKSLGNSGTTSAKPAVAAADTSAPAADEAPPASGIVKATDPKAAVPSAVVAQRTVQAGTVTARLALFQQNATKAIDAFRRLSRAAISPPPPPPQQQQAQRRQLRRQLRLRRRASRTATARCATLASS